MGKREEGEILGREVSAEVTKSGRLGKVGPAEIARRNLQFNQSLRPAETSDGQLDLGGRVYVGNEKEGCAKIVPGHCFAKLKELK